MARIWILVQERRESLQPSRAAVGERPGKLWAEFARGEGVQGAEAASELAETGEIVEKGDKGVETLLAAKLPASAGQNIQNQLDEAIALFRRRNATTTDRHNAVKMLADILEGLRPHLKKALTSKDEGDLFNIANNFEIRHRNEKQKNKYDRSLWLSWMFYFYVATLHLAMRKLEPSSMKSGQC